ncbi:unnamed protein product [Ceratitis capitata]|uniref:(Mediterranean fruit fly) hypothetical protein n=1 Tax=Ceratitis capitata TaxID=7213 RepID=A0A811V3K8_CERCA|nr:unnamed protein product [Ceratitis capitata]
MRIVVIELSCSAQLINIALAATQQSGNVVYYKMFVIKEKKCSSSSSSHNLAERSCLVLIKKVRLHLDVNERMFCVGKDSNLCAAPQ